MRRQYIVAAIVLLVVGGAGYGVWQFYLRDQLQQYNDDNTKLQQLQDKQADLQSKFGKQNPEKMIQDMTHNMQPWADALDARGKYFSTNRFVKLDTPADNTLLRAFYAEQYQKTIQDIQTTAYNNGLSLSTVDLSFGSPSPSSLSGRSVNIFEVQVWLSSIKLGCGVLRELMKSPLLRLDEFTMWDPRKANEVLQGRTFGITMWMPMKDFAALYKRLLEDRDVYYSIPGLRITNAYLRSYQDPPLHIEMLLDVVQYQPNVSVAVAKSESSESLDAMRNRHEAEREPLKKGSRSFLDWLARLFPF